MDRLMEIGGWPDTGEIDVRVDRRAGGKRRRLCRHTDGYIGRTAGGTDQYRQTDRYTDRLIDSRTQ